MHENETEILENLREYASTARSFFSNKEKPVRELCVCRAFLHSIGIMFDDCELIAPTTEPADVDFRTARFQVREMLDDNRKRGDEWKKKEEKYAQAKTIGEIAEPYSAPTPISLKTLMPKIVLAMSKKAQKYGSKCNRIDALLYINLQNQYLSPDSDWPQVDQLKAQGWRSVSFVFPPYGVILFALPSAPSFLNKIGPGQHMKWQDIESLFDVL